MRKPGNQEKIPFMASWVHYPCAAGVVPSARFYQALPKSFARRQKAFRLHRIANVAGSVIQPAGRDMISNLPWPKRDAVVAPDAMQATLPLKKSWSACVTLPGNFRSKIIPL